MKNKFLSVTVSALAVYTLVSSHKIDEPKGQDSGFAVVEVFTSEGCASCLPTDNFMDNLQMEAERNHRNIYVLNYHVDSWNTQGWTDPYSNKTFTDHRSDYSGKFTTTPATPATQVVINGTTAVTGYDSSTVATTIKKELCHKPKTTMQLLKNGSTLVYKIHCVPNGRTAYLAYVEKNISSVVTAGENSGKTLYHTGVVKSYQSVGSNREGEISIPQEYLNAKGKYAAVIYLQDTSTKEIEAAGEVCW